MSLNGPFDPRVRYTMGPNGRALTVQRGWIEEDTTTGLVAARPGGGRRVDFLFNPAAIGTSYGMGGQEQSLPTSAGMDPRDQTGVPTIIANQTLSIELLFDRTFEVNAGDTDGVWRDAKAFLTLVGVEDADGAGAPGSAGTVMGVMMFVPVTFRFGPSSPLRFLAVINSLAITYTLFNPAQIPMRCAIEVSAQLLPKSYSGGGMTPPYDDRRQAIDASRSGRAGSGGGGGGIVRRDIY